LSEGGKDMREGMTSKKHNEKKIKIKKKLRMERRIKKKRIRSRERNELWDCVGFLWIGSIGTERRKIEKVRKETQYSTQRK
jgi:hypothetical protein